jgi:uncharacterized membrane protein YeaQ/YmgE (transglycosylase-associated protein family)
MGLVLLVVLGALLGWLAAIIMRAEDTKGILLNVLAGIGGALVAGLVVNPLLGKSGLLEGRYHADGLLVSLLGSLCVLLLLNLLRGKELG